MSEKHGNLSITSENIFPVIKKWLYSDHDIFYRELISNGCDAITKLKRLDMMGDYQLPADYKPRIDVLLDDKAKTITIKDNGLGMTYDEIDEYINQIAFSGATDFLSKYKDKASEDQIIGHFGLGFYSAFMVADKVSIDSLSYKEGSTPAYWVSEGGVEFDMKDGSRDTVGTTITLFLNDDSLEFVNEYRAREVIEKYCSFMPFEIYIKNVNEETKYETIDAADKKETDTVVEEIHVPAKTEEKTKDDGTKETVETEPAKEQLKIVKREVPINDTKPLWKRTPSDITDDEYKNFYRKVFNDYKEPLFWIHLNMDYPFRLQGILYFPHITSEYESIEGTIKLYNNQVFIADNIKEVIPEYLMLLKGVIDCPDLPLNVSRSALQNDGFVTKISDYITKKVAEKLSGLCKTDRENYEKYWDDISPFIKYGCLKDEKFCDKMNDYILFKDINGKYMTLPDLLKKEEEKKADGANKPEILDKDGKPISSDDADKKPEDNSEPEDKRKPVYYVTNLLQQAQYINLFKEQGKNAVILDQPIDTSFISQLESRNENYRFLRIDSEVEDSLTEDVSPEELKKEQDALSKLFQDATGKKDLKVKVQKFKNKDLASMITLGEETRRMADMMKLYSRGNSFDTSMFGNDETLCLNANHKMVRYIFKHPKDKNIKDFANQLYDLARIMNGPISADEMTTFLKRSNDIMLLLTREEAKSEKAEKKLEKATTEA
jgi:molecular chaperone HtpG